MNITFKRNLIIGYSISLFLLIVSAIASYISIRNLLYTQELVDNTNKVIKKLDNISSILKDAETGQRGFLLTGNNDFLQPYKDATAKANTAIRDAGSAISNNALQLESFKQLENLTSNRITHLQILINDKKQGKEATIGALLSGKQIMDSARELIDQMQKREQLQLISRTKDMDRFATSTPTLILVAALLSILVTVVSFFRVSKDFEKRMELQTALVRKDKEITERLTLIQNIAEKISSGDYKTRVANDGMDMLGSLSYSLNKMAGSLDFSFSNLSDQEWLQTGIATLNEKMIGEKNLDTLTYKCIEYLAAYTNSQVGAFFLTINENTLGLSAGIALNKKEIKQQIALGEGIAGQSALSANIILLESISGNDMDINYSAGKIKPAHIIAVPVYHEKKLKGVFELATLHSYTPVMHKFLTMAAYNIGTAIHSARDNIRLAELLMETQAQSEELQSQHNELENINAELQTQAEKLQASEEELRVQQQELQQSNQELEERSRLLEEKNELILERNLDIQRKAEELAVSTKYKSEFLANMSHELRTPLNSILLLSRLLSENHAENLNGDQIEYANVIQSSGKGLLTLIDEILDLSRIESGKMELQFEPVNLKEVIKDLNSLLLPLAKDKGIDFNIELKNNSPENIETDRLRLDQILRNLISNALKFTKLGKVSLTISGDAVSIFFTVKDTGIGIPLDKQQTIFEAFQQADGSTRRQFGGTGLGLSISRQLSKLLGGEITLESEPGKGSEFTLILPLTTNGMIAETISQQVIPRFRESKIADILNPDDNYLSDIIPSAIPDDRDHILKNDKVILIIEDDTAFARSLLDYTRTKGYKGVVAVRGDEGIAFAKMLMPTGILLDLQLPVKNGWQVMDELKSDPATKAIPVHMMSSYEVKNKSLTKGAVDFINKPIAFEKLGEMFQKIEEALTRHPKKVLIVEENTKHAKALAYFLESFDLSTAIKSSVGAGITALGRDEIDCVILDMGITVAESYKTLEAIKQKPGFENLPIIIFTGKNLSHAEEMKIKQYADSIVIKTAHSYQRILDEVSLFLHLVQENEQHGKVVRYKKPGEAGEILKDKKVLIADDDVRNIFSLTRSLENYGMHILSAIDGKDAVEQLEKNDKTDIVLMDMMMPEMDGYESIRMIRKNPKFKTLPIIAVTAKAMTGDREKCINAGASDYITKPVDVDQLISLLRVWLYE